MRQAAIGNGTRAMAASAALLLACCQSKPLSPNTDATGCRAWRPSGDWSSLPTGRPANMNSWSLSASGKQLYATGVWLEDGELHRGLFRSSDLGDSWCVFSTLEGISTVAASPADDAYLYGLHWQDGRDGELLRSTDAGATWSVAPLPTGNLLALQPSLAKPEVVALSIPAGAPFLSHDGGESWEEVALPPELDTSLYAFPATFDPADPERIIAGFIVEEGLRMFATVDGGDTWRESQLPTGFASGVTTAVHGSTQTALLVSSPANVSVSTDWGQTWTDSSPAIPSASVISGPTAQAVYVTADSGLWRSDDDGLTFERMADLPDRFDPFITGLPDPDTIIANVGNTRTLTMTTDAGKSWETRPLVPMPYTLVESPVNPYPIWSTSPTTLSTDGGVSWVSTTADVGRIIPDGRDARAGFYFSEARGLRRTADGGKTWSSFDTPADVQQIHGVATCSAPAECLYLLYGSTGRPTTGSAYASSLARSSDGGRTWDDSLPVGEFYFPEVFHVAPDSPDHLFVSGGPGLMETRDGGQSWMALDLPGAASVESIAFLPDGVTLVASNNRGLPDDVVYRSEDGATWQLADVEPGRLFASHVHPGTVFLINTRILRSDDSGASWTRVSPETGFYFTSVADAPDGRFVAATELGLVSFE